MTDSHRYLERVSWENPKQYTRERPVLLIVIAIFFLALTWGTAFPQSIHGMVLDEDRAAIVNAVVSLPALREEVLTDHDGEFIINDVPRGTYLIKVERIGYDSDSMTVDILTDSASILIVLRANVLTLHDVTITAKPRPSDIANSSQAVSVLKGDQLLKNIGSSAGSELSNLPESPWCTAGHSVRSR